MQQLCCSQISDIGDVKSQKDSALNTADLIFCPHKRNKQNRHKQHHAQVKNFDSGSGKGMDQGGNTQNEQDIEDIGADNVADGNISLALERGN